METASAGETLVCTRLYVVSQKRLLFTELIGYGVGIASPTGEMIFLRPDWLWDSACCPNKYGRNVKLKKIRLRLETEFKNSHLFSAARIGP
jgi:hypothetical protein